MTDSVKYSLSPTCLDEIAQGKFIPIPCSIADKFAAVFDGIMESTESAEVKLAKAVELLHFVILSLQTGIEAYKYIFAKPSDPNSIH